MVRDLFMSEVDDSHVVEDLIAEYVALSSSVTVEGVCGCGSVLREVLSDTGEGIAYTTARIWCDSCKSEQRVKVHEVRNAK